MVPEQLELRPEVQWFAQEMEKILRKNDHKGKWQGCGEVELFEFLDNKIMTLDNALKGYIGRTDWQKVIKEATDLANYAMMIADLARKKV